MLAEGRNFQCSYRRRSVGYVDPAAERVADLMEMRDPLKPPASRNTMLAELRDAAQL